MRKVYIENYDFNLAMQNYLSIVKVNGTETIDALNCVGRITASPIFAKVCDPIYNASAMDGIALRAEKTQFASENAPVFLEEEKDFIYVNTGAIVPTQFDCVVMIEDVIDLGNKKIKLIAPSVPWQNIRVAGETIVETEMVLPSFTKIRAIDLGVILASGNEKIEVIKKPNIAIIPTGDEMVENVSSLKIGKLMESNTRVFYELAKSYGANPTRYEIVSDNEKMLENAIKRAAAVSDIVVVNAGSSCGTKDFVVDIIENLGKVYYHGLNIKPGKPTILGKIDNAMVVGVPGYPVSAYIVFEKVVRKIIEKMLNTKNYEQMCKAVMTKRITSTLKSSEFLRVALGSVNDKIVATPLDRGASQSMSMVKADGIVIVPQYVEGIEANEVVDVELLKPLEEIKNRLCIVGSHDVCLDFIADKMPISSAHVGSMAGINAFINNSCHIVPIHILDKSGVYNIPILKEKFKKGEVALIKGLKRKQGIYVNKGNPLNIKNLKDIQKGGFNFANRQNGAGTRILLDFMMTKQGILKSEIKGYEKEFSTHLAVASAVKDGGFDCGLGVQSAAKIKGLDFVFLGNEDYDFLVSQKMLKDERILKFIELIKSNEFKSYLEKLSGYETEGIGEVVLID